MTIFFNKKFILLFSTGLALFVLFVGVELAEAKVICSPAPCSFTAPQGGPSASKTLNIIGGSGDTAWSVSSAPSWLTLSQTSGTFNETCVTSVDPETGEEEMAPCVFIAMTASGAGLSPGSYSGSVQVAGDVALAVTLTVVGDYLKTACLYPFGEGGCKFNKGPLALFNLTQPLRITNKTPLFSAPWVLTLPSWLSASQTSGTLPPNSSTTVILTANPAGLAPNVYAASVRATSFAVTTTTPATFTVFAPTWSVSSTPTAWSTTTRAWIPGIAGQFRVQQGPPPGGDIEIVVCPFGKDRDNPCETEPEFTITSDEIIGADCTTATSCSQDIGFRARIGAAGLYSWSPDFRYDFIDREGVRRTVSSESKTVNITALSPPGQLRFQPDPWNLTMSIAAVFRFPWNQIPFGQLAPGNRIYYSAGVDPTFLAIQTTAPFHILSPECVLEAGCKQSTLSVTVRPTVSPGRYEINMNASGFVSSTLAGGHVPVEGDSGTLNLVITPWSVFCENRGEFSTNLNSPLLCILRAPSGSTSPPNTLTIDNRGVTSTLNWIISGTEPWLTFSRTSGTVSPNSTSGITVAANAAGLAARPQPYVAKINVSDGQNTVPLDVNFFVAQPPFALSCSNNCDFTAAVGEPPPPGQSLFIRNNLTTFLNWTAAEAASWLTLSSTAGTTAVGATTTVTVSVNHAGLAPGGYTENITVTSNPSLMVPVTLTVTGAAASFTLSCTSNCAFAGIAGVSTTTTRTVTVTNTGGSTLSWTAAKTQSWLTLSQTSGSTPAGGSSSFLATVNFSGLTPGNYTDTVTVSGGSAGSQTLTVQVAVGEPLRIIRSDWSVFRKPNLTTPIATSTCSSRCNYTASGLTTADYLVSLTVTNNLNQSDTASEDFRVTGVAARFSCSGAACVLDPSGPFTTSNCDSSCVAPTSTLTHLECVSRACAAVAGPGINRCNVNADCGAEDDPFHSECSPTLQACINVAGAGTSTCRTDTDCGVIRTTHLECQNRACVIVSGSGPNTCSKVGQGCRRVIEIAP